MNVVVLVLFSMPFNLLVVGWCWHLHSWSMEVMQSSPTSVLCNASWSSSRGNMRSFISVFLQLVFVHLRARFEFTLVYKKAVIPGTGGLAFATVRLDWEWWALAALVNPWSWFLVQVYFSSISSRQPETIGIAEAVVIFSLVHVAASLQACFVHFV